MSGDLQVHENEVRYGDIALDPVEKALEALRAGLPVLVVDDADRENEGDVILAAVNASPEWVGWTVRHTSGVLCAPMLDDRADALALPHMVERNEESLRTAYTVSVDARSGISTGISAADRSVTLRLLADGRTGPEDLVRPGHVFPLRARPGGVLERRGHTEAAVDLCVLAGLPPVGVLAEVVEDAGPVTRLPGLRALADEFGLPLISIEDLVVYRREHPGAVPEAPVAAPPRVRRVADSLLPTSHGDFRAVAYRDMLTGHEHVALVAGEPAGTGALVRVHSECLTGDAFGSSRCDCGPQLDAALERVASEGGVVIYLRGHEGRGIGLLAKLTAYQLQDSGLDTVAANTAQGLPADAREYGAAAAVLDDLGLDAIRLLTNNPAKLTGLAEHGITVTMRIGLQVGVNPHNTAYLASKRDLMGHQLDDLNAR
ncbi:GTP cyclohydrolase II [Kineosporia sp. NBRC 101731]|uniref:GTP cyclohydrolase II n=1 Tax=Kineosporia sp. NBRC 101731 TaxID=3032199 RepID=UPI0024A1676E|nr:GTP cyclohydrolase II [Kineosporia sp. NBRC 101731]GLY30628.1 riboflavin biosynthesis protein RibBA [Kineosporia sp. NBRC 101731]